MARADIAERYDARADEYVERFGSLAQMAARDTATIERWRDSTSGALLDAGCGPGHWSDVLADGGRRDVVGVDGAGRFLVSARQRFARPGFVQSDLAALPIASGAVGGLLAWYSIIHTPPVELDGVLSEFARALRPGGSLLLGFFDGEPGEAFDHAVTAAHYWSAEALEALLAPWGFRVVDAEARQDPGARRRHGPLAALLDGHAVR